MPNLLLSRKDLVFVVDSEYEAGLPYWRLARLSHDDVIHQLFLAVAVQSKSILLIIANPSDCQVMSMNIETQQ